MKLQKKQAYRFKLKKIQILQVKNNIEMSLKSFINPCKYCIHKLDRFKNE